MCVIICHNLFSGIVFRDHYPNIVVSLSSHRDVQGADVHTGTHTHTHTHKHTHSHRHTHTHKHTHIATHTHTKSLFSQLSCRLTGERFCVCEREGKGRKEIEREGEGMVKCGRGV